MGDDTEGKRPNNNNIFNMKIANSLVLFVRWRWPANRHSVFKQNKKTNTHAVAIWMTFSGPFFEGRIPYRSVIVSHRRSHNALTPNWTWCIVLLVFLSLSLSLFFPLVFSFQTFSHPAGHLSLRLLIYKICTSQASLVFTLLINKRPFLRLKETITIPFLNICQFFSWRYSVIFLLSYSFFSPTLCWMLIWPSDLIFWEVQEECCRTRHW